MSSASAKIPESAVIAARPTKRTASRCFEKHSGDWKESFQCDQEEKEVKTPEKRRKTGISGVSKRITTLPTSRQSLRLHSKASLLSPLESVSSVTTSVVQSPAALFRGTKNETVLSVLDSLNRQSNLRLAYGLATPLWAYFSAAYFSEATVLRPDALRLQEIDVSGVDSGSFPSLLGSSFDGLEMELTEELERTKRVSAELLRELRENVNQACSRDYRSAAVDAGKSSRKKREEEAWLGLIHSKYHDCFTTIQPTVPPKVVPAVSDPESDIYCDICLDGVSTTDDLIVICSKCDLAVHMTCYGIPELPEEDWYCEVCMTGTGEAVCSICGKAGGAVKSGTTKPVGVSGWSHIYCVDNLPGTRYLQPDTKSSIDLSQVDLRRCSLKCQLCSEKTGACLQCTQRSCLSSFHPGCWKTEFLTPNDPDESSFLCPKHISVSLPDRLSRLNQQYLQSLQLFYRSLTPLPLPTPPPPKPTEADIAALMKIAKKTLSMYNYREKLVGFRVIVGKKRRRVEVKTPVRWNLLSTEVFRKEKLKVNSHNEDISAELYENIYRTIRKKSKRCRVELTLSKALELDSEYAHVLVQRKQQKPHPTLIRFPLKWL